MAITVVQTQSSAFGAIGVPGSVTLVSAPNTGNLIIAILGLTDMLNSSLTVNTASWTQFNSTTRTNGSGNQLFMISLYRYVQPGDTVAMPAFCTAGSTHWGWTIYEISGVSGTWNNDLLVAMTGQQYDANFSTPVSRALPAYPAIANGSLAITAQLTELNLEAPTLTGSWTLDYSQVAFPQGTAYGSVGNAHRSMNAGDTIDGTWGQTGWEISSQFAGTVSLIIFSPAQPTTPYPRNSFSVMSVTGTDNPGVLVAPFTPKQGSLLLAFIGWNYLHTNPTIDTTHWTVFQTATLSGNDYIIGLYRYVQPGDTSTLPNLTTAGSAYWAVSVVEIDGVSGTFSADLLGTQKQTILSSPDPWATLTLTSSASNQLGVVMFAQADGRGQLYQFPSGWINATTITEFGYYGTVAIACQFYPMSGSSISTSFTGLNAPNTAGYILTGLLNAPAPPPAPSRRRTYWVMP